VVAGDEGVLDTLSKGNGVPNAKRLEATGENEEFGDETREEWSIDVASGGKVWFVASDEEVCAVLCKDCLGWRDLATFTGLLARRQSA